MLVLPSVTNTGGTREILRDLSLHMMGLVSVVVHVRTTVVPTRTVPIPSEESFMLLVMTGGRGAGGRGGGGGISKRLRRCGEEERARGEEECEER